MKRREPVSKIMSASLVTLNLSNDLYEAERLFKEHGIRHLPVVDGPRIAGILSKTDLARISFVDSYGEDEAAVDTAVYNMLSLKQVMVSNPTTIDASASIREAAEILAESEFHALPVMEGGKPVGIVTSTDLIKYLLDQY